MNTHEDILKFKEACGTASVMVARAAQANVSIFREEGPLTLEELVPEYLKMCVDVDNSVANTKYSIGIMYKSLKNIRRTKNGNQFEDATTLAEIWCVFVMHKLGRWRLMLFFICSDLWGVGEYAREKGGEYAAKGLISLPCSPLTNFSRMSDDVLGTRRQMFNDENINFAHIKFRRNFYSYDNIPKMILHAYAGRNKLPLPVYETRREDRLYYSVATFEGKKYATLVWERNRKHSEQGAALVCLHFLNLVDEDFLLATQSLYK